MVGIVGYMIGNGWLDGRDGWLDGTDGRLDGRDGRLDGREWLARW